MVFEPRKVIPELVVAILLAFNSWKE
jgi:hypothetical protein